MESIAFKLGSSIVHWAGVLVPKWMFVFPIQPSTANSLKPKSVWVECGGDPGFLANCFEREKSPSVLRRSSKRENNKEEDDEEEETTALSLVTLVLLSPVHRPVIAETHDKTVYNKHKA